MTEFVWVQHRETGGYGQCPAGVLDEMAKKGWEQCDPPEPVDPTTADALAWRATQASAAAAETKPSKSAARGKSTEGVSSDA